MSTGQENLKLIKIDYGSDKSRGTMSVPPPISSTYYAYAPICRKSTYCTIALFFLGRSCSVDTVGGVPGSSLSPEMAVIATMMFLRDMACSHAGLPDVKSEGGRINGPVTEKKHKTEHRLGDNIENAIKDSFGIRVDDIAALGHTPCNGIQEPDKDGQDSTHIERTCNGASQSLCVTTAIENKSVDDIEEGKHAERPVTPLESRAGERANKTTYNHDLVCEKGDQDCRPGKPSRK